MGYGGNFEKLKNPSKTPKKRKVDRLRDKWNSWWLLRRWSEALVGFIYKLIYPISVQYFLFIFYFLFFLFKKSSIFLSTTRPRIEILRSLYWVLYKQITKLSFATYFQPFLLVLGKSYQGPDVCSNIHKDPVDFGNNLIDFFLFRWNTIESREGTFEDTCRGHGCCKNFLKKKVNMQYIGGGTFGSFFGF